MTRSRWLGFLAVALVALVITACSASEGALDGSADRAVSDGGIDATDTGPRDAKRPVDGTRIDGGVPYLVSLEVTGPAPDGGPPMELVPAFSPNIFDYYVRCVSGENALQVAMKASPGADSLVLLPTASGLAPKQTVSLDALEGQAVVAAATDGTTTTEYWVRCLPHDFPHMKMVTHPEAGAPTPGYYLVGNLLPQPGVTVAYAMVLDGHGVPVWYAAQSVGLPVYDVDHLFDGGISFGWPFQVRELDPPPSIGLVTVLGQPIDVHELVLLPNGHYLVLFAPTQTGVDLTGLTLPLPDGGTQTFGKNGDIIACDVVEVDALGNYYWSWLATDHFAPGKDTTFLEYPLPGPDGGFIVEPYHCNSIDVDESGNLLVSSRHMDSVFYIEKSTGNVLWKMGGARASKDHATYVPVDKPFLRQHDARFVPGWKESCATGSGQISVFDDETFVPANARGVVYDVNIAPVDGGGRPDCGVASKGDKTHATLAWQYEGNQNTESMGSFRILPDGTRIIGWGSNMTVAFTEVDEKKRDLLDFYFTDNNTTYRAIKVPLSAFSIDILRSAAGH